MRVFEYRWEWEGRRQLAKGSHGDSDPATAMPSGVGVGNPRKWSVALFRLIGLACTGIAAFYSFSAFSHFSPVLEISVTAAIIVIAAVFFSVLEYNFIKNSTLASIAIGFANAFAIMILLVFSKTPQADVQKLVQSLTLFLERGAFTNN